MKRRTATWTLFAGCVACGVALLLWLTQAMLRLERGETAARAHADHEQAIGGALWQMDGWLLPVLAEEAQRPVTDYFAFNAVPEAYSNLLGKLTPGDVVSPSPLLTYDSELFPLHFQVDSEGNVTSPQVPRGNELDVAQLQTEAPQLDHRRALLDRVRTLVSPRSLLARCSTGTAALPEMQVQAQQAGEAVEQWKLNANYSQRAQVTAPARQKGAWLAPGSETKAETPPAANAAAVLVPIWLDDPASGDCLVFVRRVMVAGKPVFQGMLADWSKLSAGLLAAIADPLLARGARLERVDRPTPDRLPHLLTVVPAALCTTPPPVAEPPWSPGRTLLASAWAGLLAVTVVVAMTLRAALLFGDRRARFASAVTHELRTPLTTFRMYSEMLAQGMVPDAARRQQYLITLQSESDRLARLVENVLGYARIEEGRFTARIESIALGDLVARVRPVLEKRAADAGFPLQIEVQQADARLNADSDAVGQILFNLVDNACKYGRPPLVLTAEVRDGHVALTLRDHGSGVPARYRTRIFAPFDRGTRRPGDNEIPGVGLGLALARGLAHDLGGTLTLAECGQGACFVLTLGV